MGGASPKESWTLLTSVVTVVLAVAVGYYVIAPRFRPIIVDEPQATEAHRVGRPAPVVDDAALARLAAAAAPGNDEVATRLAAILEGRIEYLYGAAALAAERNEDDADDGSPGGGGGRDRGGVRRVRRYGAPDAVRTMVLFKRHSIAPAQPAIIDIGPSPCPGGQEEKPTAAAAMRCIARAEEERARDGAPSAEPRGSGDAGGESSFSSRVTVGRQDHVAPGLAAAEGAAEGTFLPSFACNNFAARLPSSVVRRVDVDALLGPTTVVALGGEGEDGTVTLDPSVSAAHRVLWLDLEDRAGLEGWEVRASLDVVAGAEPRAEHAAVWDANSFLFVPAGWRARFHGLPAGAKVRIHPYIDASNVLEASARMALRLSRSRDGERSAVRALWECFVRDPTQIDRFMKF